MLLSYSTLLKAFEAVVAGLAPLGFVQCLGLPLPSVDAAGLEGRLQDILVSLVLPAPGSMALVKFSIEQCLWYSLVVHAYHVACPAKLGFHEEGFNARDSAALENLCVGDLVLPMDVADLAETSQVELV